MATKTIAKTKTRLNLRLGPSTDFEVLTVLRQLAVLDVIEQRGDWLRVRFEKYDGYVHSNYVILETVETPDPSQEPKKDTATKQPTSPTPEPKTEPTTQSKDDQDGKVSDQKLSGKTKTRLNLRTGPGTAYRVIRTLPSNAPFDVIEVYNDWLQVKMPDRDEEGYLHVNYVTLEVKQVSTEPAKKTETEKKTEEKTVAVEAPAVPGPLEDIPLALPEDQQLPVNPNAPLLERLVSDAWNRYGSLLKVLASQLNIDPAVAVAVLAVESGGRGFSPDGRMIIRFENHVFWDYWGKNNQRFFDDHFKFDPNARWLGHQFRAEARGKNWVTMHVRSQDIEWQVFEFASRINLTAARLSISMGGPQIMGFNYPVIGFDSVHAMYDAFNANERNQVIGFFDFVKGRTTPSKRLEALKNLDFEGFAKQYNGSGQAKKYGGLIKNVFDIFHQLTDK